MLDVDTQLHSVARDSKIATKWKTLATNLGFTQQDITQIEMENERDV